MAPNSPGPDWLKIWGTRAWWAVGIGLALFGLSRAFGAVALIALPVVIGAFPASILWSPVGSLQARGMGRGLASLLVMIPAVGLLAGAAWVIGSGLAGGFSDLGEQIRTSGDELREWLESGPLGLSSGQIDGHWDRIVDGSSDAILGGLGTGLELVAGALLTVVMTFFLLKDGARLVAMVGRLFGLEDEFLDGAAVARRTLARYLVGLAATGIFDAVVIGVGLVVIGVPLALPLSVLIFFGAFFPIIGAWTTGLVAVVVALISGGVGDALWATLLITVVQQIEGDVVMPLLVGDVVALHPMLVLIGVIGGGAAFGVAGAFLAVPLIAAVNRVSGSRRGRDPLSV